MVFATQPDADLVDRAEPHYNTFRLVSEMDVDTLDEDLVVLIEHQIYHNAYSNFFSTCIKIGNTKFLVAGSSDIRLGVNTSLDKILPGVDWHGDVVAFRLGRNVPFFSRSFSGEKVDHAVRL